MNDFCKKCPNMSCPRREVCSKTKHLWMFCLLRKEYLYDIAVKEQIAIYQTLKRGNK